MGNIPSIGVPQNDFNGWFLLGNVPGRIDDLEVPPFMETPI